MPEITVLASGVFDLLHPGHLAHLEEAKGMGDKLVVSITADKYVSKGPGRPVYNEAQRAAHVAALRCVDDVFICEDSSSLPAIRRFRPDIYVKGPDYAERKDGTFALEKKQVETLGGKVCFTDGATDSSSRIINQFIAKDDALEAIRQKYTYKDISVYLDACQELIGWCYGENIRDQYVYVRPAYKSAKELLIDYVENEVKNFNGGILAVRDHLKGLCPKSEAMPTQQIVKRRYVDEAFGQKLYSVCTNDKVAPLETDVLKHGDFNVVVDYGHGLFDYKAILDMCSANFLALNVQANGLNWGFNRLQRWPSANYVVVDEPELRLSANNRDGDIKELIWYFVAMGWKYFAVTMGHKGAIVFDRDGNSATLPAMASNVVDRIGAGDAFLAVTAPLAYLGAPVDVIALIGNIAGGLHVGTVGNSAPVTRRAIDKVLRSVLA